MIIISNSIDLQFCEKNYSENNKNITSNTMIDNTTTKSRITIDWDINDTAVPLINVYDDYSEWANGHCRLVYAATNEEAKKHSSGWAMRNTNNHNVNILKKSCLGVLLCSAKCKLPNGDGVHLRPAICDKARRKQQGKNCPNRNCTGRLVIQPCRGHCGYPVTHFWRQAGNAIFFQAKGTHDHARPEAKGSSVSRRALGLSGRRVRSLAVMLAQDSAINSKLCSLRGPKSKIGKLQQHKKSLSDELNSGENKTKLNNSIKTKLKACVCLQPQSMCVCSPHLASQTIPASTTYQWNAMSSELNPSENTFAQYSNGISATPNHINGLNAVQGVVQDNTSLPIYSNLDSQNQNLLASEYYPYQQEQQQLLHQQSQSSHMFESSENFYYHTNSLSPTTSISNLDYLEMKSTASTTSDYLSGSEGNSILMQSPDTIIGFKTLSHSNQDLAMDTQTHTSAKYDSYDDNSSLTSSSSIYDDVFCQASVTHTASGYQYAREVGSGMGSNNRDSNKSLNYANGANQQQQLPITNNDFNSNCNNHTNPVYDSVFSYYDNGVALCSDMMPYEYYSSPTAIGVSQVDSGYPMKSISQNYSSPSAPSSPEYYYSNSDRSNTWNIQTDSSTTVLSNFGTLAPAANDRNSSNFQPNANIAQYADLEMNTFLR